MAPVQFYWSVYALFKRQVLVHNFRLAYGHIYDVVSVLAIIVRVNIVFLHVDVIVVLINIFFTIELLWAVFTDWIDWLIEFSVLLLRHLKRSWIVLLKGDSLPLKGSCRQRTLSSVDLEVGYGHSARTLNFIPRNVMLGPADRLLNSQLLELGVGWNVLVRRGVIIIGELRGGGRNFLKVLALGHLSQTARPEEVDLILGWGWAHYVVATFIDFMHLNVAARLAVLKGLSTPQQILIDSELRNFWKFRVMPCDGLDQCAKIGSSNSKDKSPIVLRV